MFERTCKLLCYDFITLFYMVLIGFEVVWAILGLFWLFSNSSACQALLSTTLAIILLILLWVFLLFGACVTFLALSSAAYQEGSCSLGSLLGCCWKCITCELLNPDKVRRRSRGSRNQSYRGGGEMGRESFYRGDSMSRGVSEFHSHPYMNDGYYTDRGGSSFRRGYNNYY